MNRLGRPKIALISRDIVLDVTLKIIDERGLDALSIRAIAKEIGVKAASLYHHFHNKDEIINCAAEMALTRTALQPLDGAEKNWQALLTAGTYQLLTFLLDHPQLVPVFAQRRVVGLGDHFLEGSLKHLIAAGMSVAIILPLFEALEALSLGWVTRQITAQRPYADRPDAGSFPLLQMAEQSRIMGQKEVYTLGVQAIIERFAKLTSEQRTPLLDGREIGLR